MHGAGGPPVTTMHGPGGPSVAAVHSPGGTGYCADHLRRDRPSHALGRYALFSYIEQALKRKRLYLILPCIY